jgi:hypothetical protein
VQWEAQQHQRMRFLRKQLLLRQRELLVSFLLAAFQKSPRLTRVQTCLRLAAAAAQISVCLLYLLSVIGLMKQADWAMIRKQKS